MPDTPLISVVMPVYNTARYLHSAMRSILDQTFRDFEFLVYDDASTDGSRQIAEQFAAQDPRVRVIASEKVGYVPLLRRGVEEARGEFVARMDSDDIALPTRFEKQVAFLREHPEVVALGTRVLQIDPDDYPICELSDTRFTHDEIEQDLLHRRGIALLHPSMMMRREAVLRVGNYRLEMHPSEDIDLFLRLAEIGKLANLPEVLLKYRRHPGSVCGTHGDKQVQVMNEIVAQAHARRGKVAPPELTQVKPPPPPTFDQLHQLWAWQALRSGYLTTARRHAVKHLRMRPFSKMSWKLIYCVLRGR
jgi:glycosyltransferase involved in cell wall biosynthesis